MTSYEDTEFKLGDRVFSQEFEVFGVGTIVVEHELSPWLGVRFDNAHFGLHDLMGKCDNNHEYWILPEHLEYFYEDTEEDETPLDVNDIL